MEITVEIRHLEWAIKHEELFLNDRIKELKHLKDTIKESGKRLKKFNDDLNVLKQKQYSTQQCSDMN